MPIQTQLLPIPIPDAGATVSLEGLRYIERYVISLTQTGTMSGNTSITGDGFTTTGSLYVLEFPGGMTLGVQTCTIFGVALTATQCLYPCLIIARYNGATYDTQIYTDWNLIKIVNANVDAAAAIAYSKLALTGAIVNADVNAAAAIAYSKLALTGSILNADINAAAAIAYSKLALTGSILNADINAAAAIAYSKLALTGSILNADINAAAAIAYSKLALTGSIVNADVNAAAAIAYSKLNLASSIAQTDLDSECASFTFNVLCSFETGEQCNNRVRMSFPGTITNVYGVVVKALSGTDAGTVTPKNGAGTTMTLASALSYAASSALETAIDTAVSANNTFVDGDILYFTGAKTTVGGKVLLTVEGIRT